MTATKPRDDVDAFIDSIDPTTMRDGRRLRGISAAVADVDHAHQALVNAIRDARAAGDSWTMIAIALGTSRQNAHRKYAHLVEAPGAVSDPVRRVDG